MPELGEGSAGPVVFSGSNAPHARRLAPASSRTAEGLTALAVGRQASVMAESVLASFMAALVGGVVGWSLVFAGLRAWGLAIGVLVTLGALWLVASRRTGERRFGFMVGFAFAFVLLTWPLLWVGVGYLRFLLTGEALGD
jgi:F0F1-type ATP synthase assembly protein I